LTANKSNAKKYRPATQRLCKQTHICFLFNALHTMCDCLTLSLLVTPIFTDDAHNTVATDDLAVAADTLD
jgi:hypothetical protein